MVSELFTFQISTTPNQIINITDNIKKLVNKCSIRTGILTVFMPGSTGGISFLEYEPGLVKSDVPELLQRLLPEGPDYKHHQTWGDHNGHSHLRSFLIPPSQTIPLVDGKLVLGTWQQIVFCEFDEKPRNRKIYCQFTG
ncbi:MAG: secondary thiamine-phosphate synthase enzyme YjbQ [Candidatus Lokiarchaeota archaeon]|nr:secondary thiamine-phosphate synthase enzyme YjbQ [Candidatus Harpocratesius repetitus]